MVRIEAHFRVVTPLFLAGFDQSTAELRVPSIKGVLRFWWRALEHEVLGSRLREIESKIFGSTQRQSAILLRVEKVSGFTLYSPGRVLPEADSADGHNDVNHGVRYFGYGVMESFDGKATKAGRLTRGALSPGELRLHVTLKDSRYLESVLRALRLMGLLGGLGSKSRKGYGSLSLVTIRRKGDPEPLWTAPTEVDTLKKELAELLKHARNSKPHDKFAPEPEYTVLSQLTQIILLPSVQPTSAMKLLNSVGREMIRYRSYGKNNKILAVKKPSEGWIGERHEANFQRDHDQMKLGTARRTFHPQRVVFGLPHNYGKPPNQHVTFSVPSSLDRTEKRRASPLFIHIHHPLVGKDPIAVVAFLPAKFLPNSAKINVGGKHIALSPNHWQPVLDFLERLKGTSTTPNKLKRKEEQLGTAVEVV